jgi:hypothetical protein
MWRLFRIQVLMKYEIAPDARRYIPDTMLCFYYDQYWEIEGTKTKSPLHDFLLVVPLSKIEWDNPPQKLYELLFEIETMLSKVQLINSFIDGYIENPTKENYNSLVEHLWIISTTAIIYSQLFTTTNKNYIKDQSIEIQQISIESGNPITNADFEDMDEYFSTIGSKMDAIIESIPPLIESLDYAASGKRIEYDMLPISKNNKINKRAYLFNTSNLYDMMFLFATALTPNELYNETLERSRGNFEHALHDLPVIVQATIIIEHFRDKLFTEIENKREYINLMHFINLFFVFGNFEKNEELPFVILNEHQVIDLEELKYTVFLYNNSHGIIQNPLKMTKITHTDPIPRPDISRVPEGMTIFTQKFTEPLCHLFSCTTNCGVYCTNKCINTETNECNCVRNIPSSVTIKEVATHIDHELKNNKIPSLPFIHHTKNKINETWHSAIGEEGSKEEIMEDKNAETIAKFYCDPEKYMLRVNGNLVPFGRIATKTDEYHDKEYTIDLTDCIGKGLYNMLTGELINANPNFVDFIMDQPHSGVETLDHILIDDEDHNTTLIYVDKYKLSMVIDFFNVLNYRNIIFVDESCEIYNLFKQEMAKLERIKERRGLEGKSDKKRYEKLKQEADILINETYKYGLGVNRRKTNKKKTKRRRRQNKTKKLSKRLFLTKKRKYKSAI